MKHGRNSGELLGSSIDRMPRLTHRPEVDGLRTLAIAPVVLYHAGVPGIPGGFVGVDIFFVISGYLISRILLHEIDGGTFSFARFYERRIRRIMPALFAMLLFCLLCAPIVALPEQLKDTSASAISALLSVSNFYFRSHSGYFAPVTDLMPLLHTWSLGVEEQFYFIYPLLLYFCTRLRLNIRLWLGLSLAPLLACSVWLSFYRPVMAFYLLPARAWELALGGALAAGVFPVIERRVIREALSVCGLGMILVSTALINAQTPFPGWAAILPCAGTALIIHCARGGVAVERLLSLRPIVFIGLISYSLYLWHWPVFVFGRMLLAKMHLSPTESCIAVAITVVLSVASWKFVEQPFRSKTTVPNMRLRPLLGGAAVAVLCIGAAGLLSKGLPERLNPEAARLLAASEDLDMPFRDTCIAFQEGGRSKECRFGPQGAAVSYVIIGDSHAAALRPAIQNAAIFRNQAGTLWFHGSCPLLVDVHRTGDIYDAPCNAFKARAMNALEHSPEIRTVVLAARWAPILTGVTPEGGTTNRKFLKDGESAELSEAESERVFRRGFSKAVDRITALGKQVIVLGGIPEPGFDVPNILALAAFNRRASSPSVDRQIAAEREQRVSGILREVVGQHAGAHYIPMWDIFCAKECAVVKDGVPLYSDLDHITYKAAVAVIGPVLDARLRSQKI